MARGVRWREAARRSPATDVWERWWPASSRPSPRLGELEDGPADAVGALRRAPDVQRARRARGRGPGRSPGRRSALPRRRRGELTRYTPSRSVAVRRKTTSMAASARLGAARGAHAADRGRPAPRAEALAKIAGAEVVDPVTVGPRLRSTSGSGAGHRDRRRLGRRRRRAAVGSGRRLALLAQARDGRAPQPRAARGARRAPRPPRRLPRQGRPVSACSRTGAPGVLRRARTALYTAPTDLAGPPTSCALPGGARGRRRGTEGRRELRATRLPTARHDRSRRLLRRVRHGSPKPPTSPRRRARPRCRARCRRRRAARRQRNAAAATVVAATARRRARGDPADAGPRPRGRRCSVDPQVPERQAVLRARAASRSGAAATAAGAHRGLLPEVRGTRSRSSRSCARRPRRRPVRGRGLPRPRRSRLDLPRPRPQGRRPLGRAQGPAQHRRPRRDGGRARRAPVPRRGRAPEHRQDLQLRRARRRRATSSWSTSAARASADMLEAPARANNGGRRSAAGRAGDRLHARDPPGARLPARARAAVLRLQARQRHPDAERR